MVDVREERAFAAERLVETLGDADVQGANASIEGGGAVGFDDEV
jgi:hypothetical protein